MFDRAGQILAVAILFSILSWVSVGLRVYVKARMLKQFGWDDGAMMATLVLFTAYLTCQLGSVANGNGQHRSQLSDETAQRGLMFWFFCEIFYTLSTSVLKIALGLFLLRIANDRYHIWIIKAIMYCSGCLGVAYCCIVIFQCKPTSYWWDLNPNHHGRCLSASVMVDTTYVVSALNSLADWVFGILPIFIVRNLHMKSHTKVVVAFILGFAAVGSAATIIRMPYLWTVKQYKGDFLWRTADVAIWTTVEVGIGITAGNVATLRPLLQRFLSLIGVNPSTARNTSNWAAKNSKFGSKGYMNSGTALEEFNKSAIKTTVTIRGGAISPSHDAHWPGISRTDSHEELGYGSYKGHDGILHTLEVNTFEERADSVKNSEPDEESGLSTSPKPTVTFEGI